jgi:hypothetical protein
MLDKKIPLIYATVMLTHPLNHTKWSDRLAFDVALTLENSGATLTEVTQIHGITTHDILNYNKDPVFLRKVEAYRADIREKGYSFTLKARSQAEELLTTSWMLIHDTAVSPAVKADLIKSTVKWAGLEPKGNDNSGATSGGIKITINMGGQQVETTLIEHTPVEEIDATDTEYLE